MAECIVNRGGASIGYKELWTTSDYTTRPTSITLSESIKNYVWLAIQVCRWKPATHGIYCTILVRSDEFSQRSQGHESITAANTGLAFLTAGNNNDYVYANGYIVTDNTTLTYSQLYGSTSISDGGYPVKIWGITGLNLEFPWFS